MFDAKSKNLVFRGTAEDELSDNPDRNKSRLEKASTKLFKNFPLWPKVSRPPPETRSDQVGTAMRSNTVWKTAALVALLGAAIACAGAPRQRPVKMGPVATGPARSQTRASFCRAAGPSSRSKCVPRGRRRLPAGTGVLTYDDFGNLRMEIRTDTATSDQLRAAGIAIQDGVLSTDGRTVIDPANRTLTYFLEGQSSSLVTGGGPLAPNRPRHWEVTADTLTLTTRDDNGARPRSAGGGEASRPRRRAMPTTNCC